MKILKSIFKWLGLLLVLCGMVLSLPRLCSSLHRGQPPVGYFFKAPTYLALALRLEKLVDRAPPVPAEIEEIKDVEYKSVDGRSLQVDFYIPRGLTEEVPLVVFIHGGAWAGGKRSDYLPYLIPFALQGYITATVSYRLIKEAPYPACIEDICDAVQWFFRNGERYGYDPGRIALVGGSAGAHLALLAAYGWCSDRQAAEMVEASGPEGIDSPGSLMLRDSITSGHARTIRAVVDIYGPFDLTTPYSRTHRLVTRLFGHSYEENPEKYLEGSPFVYLDAADPPTLIIHGTADRLVPVSQSDSLNAMLGRMGVPHTYCRMPGWPHTMDLAQRVNDYTRSEMTRFFETWLK